MARNAPPLCPDATYCNTLQLPLKAVQSKEGRKGASTVTHRNIKGEIPRFQCLHIHPWCIHHELRNFSIHSYTSMMHPANVAESRVAAWIAVRIEWALFFLGPFVNGCVVAVCCSVLLQWVALFYSVLQCFAMCLQCVTAYLNYTPEEVSFVNEPSMGKDFSWISMFESFTMCCSHNCQSTGFKGFELTSQIETLALGWCKTSLGSPNLKGLMCMRERVYINSLIPWICASDKDQVSCVYSPCRSASTTQCNTLQHTATHCNTYISDVLLRHARHGG